MGVKVWHQTALDKLGIPFSSVQKKREVAMHKLLYSKPWFPTLSSTLFSYPTCCYATKRVKAVSVTSRPQQQQTAAPLEQELDWDDSRIEHLIDQNIQQIQTPNMEIETITPKQPVASSSAPAPAEEEQVDIESIPVYLNKKFRKTPVSMNLLEYIRFFGQVKKSEWKELQPYNMHQDKLASMIQRPHKIEFVTNNMNLWEQRQKEQQQSSPLQRKAMNHFMMKRTVLDTNDSVPPYVNWVLSHKMKQYHVASNVEQLLQKPIHEQSSGLPEIVFAGRSNAGKSTLINSITERYVMKASATPGETKQLSFYKVGKYLTIVDVPGYGFAFSKEEETTQQWEETMKKYFEQGKQIRMLYLLLDARHGLKEKDVKMIRYLESVHVPYRIVLTKTDFMYPDDLARVLYRLRDDIDRLKLKHICLSSNTKEQVEFTFEGETTKEQMDVFAIPVSSKTKSGISFLKKEIVQYALDAKTFDLDWYKLHVEKSKSLL